MKLGTWSRPYQKGSAPVCRPALGTAASVGAFDYDQFLRRVAAHLDVSAPKAEEITRAVFTAVRQTLPVKEQQDVAGQLPWDLEQLWRST